VKKKVIWLVLAISLLLLPQTVSAAEPPPAPIEGDVNGDGEVDKTDAEIIAQFTVDPDGSGGVYDFDTYGDLSDKPCLDTNDDGVVNIVDAMHIAQYDVDPFGHKNILYKPVWEEDDADDGCSDPNKQADGNLRGDFNADGIVSCDDANAIAAYTVDPDGSAGINTLGEPTADQLSSGDYNRDGVVNIIDAMCIAQDACPAYIELL